ncbi:MAG TPA: hypothetical protein VHH36_00885 [Candidatus Thermoplasmatota archaeon]|nr:hypothetical protein [Candidatus Thermoplasmatota archaeon]
MILRRLAVALAAVALLSGCLSGDDPVDERKVTASGGKVSDGWAYDGVGVADGQASLDASFRNSDNTGTLVATFQHAGSAWKIEVSRFEGASDKPFQDGGVAFDLDEHGDTGVADKSIPRIHAVVAAWGVATVTRDGQPVAGKDNKTEWAAHLMVSSVAVRGPDGKIAAADGSTPYSPDKPADARTYPDDAQALLFVKSPDGEAAKRAPVTGAASFQCADPECVVGQDLAAEKGAKVAVVVNLTAAPTPADAPIAFGQVKVVLLDAAGTEIASKDAQVTPATPTASVPFDVPSAAGPMRVEVRGGGAYGVDVAWTFAYDDHPFLVLTWDDPQIA